MKKKISALLLSIALLCQGAVNAQVFDINNADATFASSPVASGIYTEQGQAYRLTGDSAWKIKQKKGTYRIWYWVSAAEDAASDVVVNINAEHVKKDVPVDFSKGNTGWREITFASCGAASDLLATIKPGSTGNTYFTAIRFQLLNDSMYSDLAKFTQSNPDHIILVGGSKTAYVDSARVYLKHSPVVKDGNFYVAVNDLHKLTGLPLPSFGEELKILNGDLEMVNFTAIQESLGRNHFSYNNKLGLYSESAISYNAAKDKKALRNIIHAVNFGE